MDQKTTVPITLDDCIGSIKDVLDRIEYSNGHGIMLVSHTVSDTEVELTFRYPE